MFNIVFLCTLVSLVLQGTSLPLVGKWLDVSDAPEPEQQRSQEFDIEFPEEIKSTSSEIEITDEMLKRGHRLMDLRMPEKTLAIMVKRDENYFVPTGKTVLHGGDRLMVLTDNKEALENTLKILGALPKEEPEAPKRKWWRIFFEEG
jgi:cell volume regulation protein A